MKKIVEIDMKEGLEKLLGQNITIFCMNYFYSGKLIGVNETCVLLENPSIVYETGAFSSNKWADCQSLHTDNWYVQISAIESFGVLKKKKS